MEIFVRPFPITEDGGLWQVSSGGGTHPLWSGDGEELFYLDAEGAMVAVAVETSGRRWIPSVGVQLFNGPYHIREATLSRQYDVNADGSRFLMIRDAPAAANPPRIVLVQNWADEPNASLVIASVGLVFADLDARREHGQSAMSS